MNLFELEDDFLYYCSAYGESRVFRFKDKKLEMFNDSKNTYEDVTMIDQRWVWTEIPEQRNKCSKCSRIGVVRKNAVMCMGKFYTGIYCNYCQFLTPGPDAPKIPTTFMVIENE